MIGGFLNLCVYVYPAEAGELQFGAVTKAPLVELPAGRMIRQTTMGGKTRDGGIATFLDALL